MNKYCPHRSSQSGVALIVVLLILAVMVSLAATMSDRLFTSFKRAENQKYHQQAYWYAIGVEALAKYAVDESKQDGDTINMSQPWALEEQVYPLDDGQAAGHIRDMQSCFNLNALAGELQTTGDSTKPYLVTVLQLTLEELGVDSYKAEVIADSAYEFLDSNDSAATNFGVEDSTYESLQPSYLTPGNVVADASEFRAIYQTDPIVMRLIAPILCAIPTDDWRLNVNTIDENGAYLLTALFSPNLSLSDAQALVDNRPFDGWQSLDDFMDESRIASIDGSIKERARGYLTVNSNYFELDAQVMVEDSRVRIRSLLYSENGDDVEVVRRRFGGISE
ncbi:type II secretion system minor pseudopilin GspK [Vibrio hannami]|uniref:type II secretion system minor pseudopilin GspK n=1 Tax=Vibrio hannami TaxID=2717094 RepID=UPI00240F8816|nr:type II secretion system minor pseudopilin GspK [Vibrio hannami]MDG3086859.1 type II secretion system minor pseudopilin GspK [Vibrio hannami]